MRASTLTLVCALPLLAIADEPKESPAAKELKLLNGTWVVTSISYSGESIPMKDFAGSTVTIKGDTYTIRRDGLEMAEWKIKLDASKSPKWITLTVAGKTTPARVGIFERKGDTLKLAMAGVKRKDSRPKAFKSVPGVNYVTLQRAKNKK